MGLRRQVDQDGPQSTHSLGSEIEEVQREAERISCLWQPKLWARRRRVVALDRTLVASRQSV